jgi:hypothetical protein
MISTQHFNHRISLASSLSKDPNADQSTLEQV